MADSSSSTMADSSSSTSFKNAHLQDPNPPPFSSSIPTKPPKSKFHFTHYFFSKSLIIILVLLVFSFFPSQVPEFFKKTTIVTKLWELFYLLIIGIAVCYGLFSRKMDRIHSFDELTHFDDNTNGAKETYLSGISHISSIFEDGIQSSYGFDEKDLFEECKGSGSRLSEFGNGFVKSDEKKLNHYFLGESMVVINDENYVLEQLSNKPKTIKQNKPLCMPVRSLGSKSLDSTAGKPSNGGGCNSVVNDSSSVGGNGIKNRKFRGLVPIKLEEKFKETDSDSDSTTPLNWRSKSMRLEKREDSCNSEADESSNFRPLSVGVHDFKGLRSKSLRFSMPISSKEILKGYGNHGSSKEILKDFGNPESCKEILKDFGNHGSSKEILKDFGNPESCKEILKGYGDHGSFKEIAKDFGNHGSSKEILKDFGNPESCEEILKDFGNHGSCEEILKDFGNHGSCKETVKDFGKIKVEGDTVDSNNKASLIMSNDQRSSIGSLMNLETFEYALGKEEKPDSSNSSPKVTNTYKRGKSVRTNRPKERVIEAKVKIFPNQTEDFKAEKESKPGTDVNVDDTEPHSGEVDRKAEEFIAKFREQIRLQQAASARRLNL